MIKIILIVFAMLSLLNTINCQAVITKNYPTFKQCDASWGGETMGPNGYSVCNYGCFMTDLAMILNANGIPVSGQSANPSNLNQFLRTHGGYNADSQFQFGVLPQISSRLSNGGTLGYLNFQQVKSILTNPNQNLIAWVDKDTHYVLVTGYDETNSDIVYVNDPYYNYSFYYGQGIDGWVVIDVSSGNFLEK